MVNLDPNRILSVQSHVVSGYVGEYHGVVLALYGLVLTSRAGNRAATFPLQTLGYDVDVINTVQFSNHTGYGHTNGHKTTPEQLLAVFEGLFTNGLTGYMRVLTGYIPGAEALSAVGEQVARLKQRKEVIYLLDREWQADRLNKSLIISAVMGDIGTGLYVSPDVVPVYKRLLNLATIITPNQFEAE